MGRLEASASECESDPNRTVRWNKYRSRRHDDVYTIFTTAAAAAAAMADAAERAVASIQLLCT